MDAGLFLEQFGHLADSPGGIGKLRNLILDLAARGRLVPQNPDDEPASELLKRIEAEKKRLIKAGEIKLSKPLPPVSEDDIPYNVPDGWVWVRLGEVTTKMGAGSTPLGGSKVYVDDGIPFLRSQNVWNDGLRLEDVARIPHEIHEDMSGTHVRSRDVLLNITGASIGRCTVVPCGLAEANVSQHVAILRLIDTRIANYLHLCVISPMFQQTIMDVQVGVSREGLSMSRLKLFPFAVPPLAEQQRIVAKVDELMALCDQLEAEQTERDHLRERAAKSTLYHLTGAPTRAEARRYWHDAEQNFPHLFDRSATVADLRATILQLAVQGRLVPQNPDDEPASKLLKRIEAEKRRLIKAGELKPSKPLPPVGEDEVPYDVPDGWVWVRVDTITTHIQTGPFGSNLHKDEYITGGIPIVNPSNMIDGQIIPDEDKTLDQETFERLSVYALEQGDLVMARRGELGRCVIVTDREVGWLCGTGSLILKTSSYIYKPFLWLFFQTEMTQEYLTGNSVGSTMDNLNQKILLRTPFPLAPINQMHRTVAKVDELMHLCDQLEAGADARQALSGRLFDSIVYHLFEPSVVS